MKIEFRIMKEASGITDIPDEHGTLLSLGIQDGRA